MNDFKIVAESKFQKLYYWLFVIVLLIGAYFYARYDIDHSATKEKESKQELKIQIDKYTGKLEQISQEKLIIEQKLRLANEMVKVLENSYKELNKKNSQLSDEVSLYARIMKPSSDKVDFVVHKLDLKRMREIPASLAEHLKNTIDHNVYRLDFFLVNYGLSKKVLKGNLDVTLYDQELLEIKDLFWYNKKNEKTNKFPVRFKYYQQSINYVVLEKGIDITKIKLDIKINNSVTKPSELVISKNTENEITYLEK